MSISDAPAAPSQVTAVRVVSSCGTIDAFVSLFSRLFDVDQMWILTPQVMPGGTHLAVLITLSDGEVALSFTGDVMQAFPASAPTPYGRPGMLVKILSVPPTSRPVMQRLHEASREFGQSTRVAVSGDEEREVASLEDMEADVETVGAAEQAEVFGPGAAQEEIFSASFTARQRTTSDTLPQPLDMKMDPGMAPPPVVAFTPVVEPVPEPVPGPVPEPEVAQAAPAAPEVAPATSPGSSRPPWPVVIALITLAFLVGYWLG